MSLCFSSIVIAIVWMLLKCPRQWPFWLQKREKKHNCSLFSSKGVHWHEVVTISCASWWWLDWIGLVWRVLVVSAKLLPVLFSTAQIITQKVLLVRHLLNCNSVLLPAKPLPFFRSATWNSTARSGIGIGRGHCMERAIIRGRYLRPNHRVPTWEVAQVAECWNWIAWWSAI